MTILHTMRNPFCPARKLDVTVADTAFDGSTKGARYTDITRRDIYELDEACNGIEVLFAAEADDGDTFGCEILNVTRDGLADMVADVTGAVGTAWADMTNIDSTERLFVDDLSISAEYHLKEVTVADQGNNRFAKLGWDTIGARAIYFRFYNVGGGGQCARIRPWVRFF